MVRGSMLDKIFAILLRKGNNFLFFFGFSDLLKGRENIY